MTELTYKSLFNQNSSAKKMIIMGHRGGFRPGNSLQSFQQAIDNNLQGIELDVWLTKDKELVVLHGGDSGEINFACTDSISSTFSRDKQYVFEATLAENRMTEPSFVMPTLREVFELTAKRLFINIEMKVPQLEEPRSRYNLVEATEVVHKLIQEFDVKEHCFISSFNQGNILLPLIDNLNERTGYHVRTVYLHNFYPEYELPPTEELVHQGDGVHISYEALTEEVVNACHANDKIVMVWVDCSVTSETVEMYKRLIDLGVDCFCSDWPLEVTQLRDSIMRGDKMDKLELPKATQITSLFGGSALGSSQTKESSTEELSQRGRAISFDDEEFVDVEANMKALNIM